MMEAMFKKEDIKAGYLLRFWDKREDRHVNMTVAPVTGLGLPAFLADLFGETPRRKDGGAGLLRRRTLLAFGCGKR